MELEQKSYLNKIVERCHWRLENDPTFRLSNLKVATISGEVLNLIYTYDKLEEHDQLILKTYFETDDSTKLILIAKNKKEAFGKAIQRLLKGETKMPNNSSLIDMSALLVDLQPRPFKRDFKYQQVSVEKVRKSPIKLRSKNRFYGINIVGLVGIVAVVALALFFATLNNDNNARDKQELVPSITINTENFIVSDLNKVIPNQSTQFFDANNKPQVWYASHNNQLDFYNTSGKHPVTNAQLQPVTKDIIKTIYVEKNSFNKKEQSLIKISDNSSLINSKDKKEISVFIFDSLNKIENSFASQLKRELTLKKYKITSSLIIESKLNPEIIEHLKSSNFSSFDKKISDYTDFICVGEVVYSFRKNKLLSDKITCELQIQYSIVSSLTGDEIDSYSSIISGYGSSKSIAKNNTIKKFKL